MKYLLAVGRSFDIHIRRLIWLRSPVEHLPTCDFTYKTYKYILIVSKQIYCFFDMQSNLRTKTK